VITTAIEEQARDNEFHTGQGLDQSRPNTSPYREQHNNSSRADLGPNSKTSQPY